MGWGKGGKGWGPHHHHHRGPGVGLIAAEAAVVGAVAGATIATVAARPPPRPKPRPVYRGPEVIVIESGRPAPAPVVVAAPPVAQAQPVVVVSGTYPKAKPWPKPKGKGKGKGKAPIVVVDNTPPLSISSINMQLPFAEIRGITYFYAVDVVPESGNPWRVMRSYKEFEDLFFKLGRQSFPAASFPQSLDKMASGDGRYDFGMGIGTCSFCKAKCRNRGDRESRTVYCSTCYPLRFPDTAVLQSQHHQLESWLKNVIQHPSSRGAWMGVLRGFLEAGREFISTAPTAKASLPQQPAPSSVPKQAAYAQSSPTPTPMPTPSQPPVEHNDEQGDMMSIEIPAGVTAGQIIAITVPNGKQVQFTVPEGQKGGDTVTLWYDSVAGTLTTVDDSEEQSESDQALSIQVPAGVNSGQLIAITVPDGRQIQFAVPDGKRGGDQLELWFDSAAGTLTPLL